MTDTKLQPNRILDGEMVKIQLAEIEALKAQARKDITPLERMRIGFEIKQKENKINGKHR